MKKLKARWNIKSNFQLILIFIVFAVTGSSSLLITAPILHFLGISKINLNLFLYYFFKVIIVFPIYQILLVFFGYVVGQFEFFWNFEKKMLTSLGFGFLLK